MSWQKYQNDIYQYLSHFYQDARITEDVYLESRSGGKKRQIDILIEFFVVGFYQFAIVDCKFYSRKIDKKNIEEFAGLIEDVGATHGILVTKTGFTEGAIKRAKTKNINLEIANIGILENESYMNFMCRGCQPSVFRNNRGYVEAISWFQYQADNVRYYIFYGMCDECLAYNFYCPVCNTVTPIPFDPTNEGVFSHKCIGDCNVTFYIEYYIIRDEFGKEIEHSITAGAM